MIWELTAAQWLDVFTGVGAWTATPALILSAFGFCWKLERRMLRLELAHEFDRRKPDAGTQPGTFTPKRRSDIYRR